MSIKINFNTDDFVETFKDAAIIYDKLNDAMLECLIKNFKEEVEKIAKGYRRAPLYKELEMRLKK